MIVRQVLIRGVNDNESAVCTRDKRWLCGHINCVVPGAGITVRYENGTIEAHVDLDRVCVAPTPLMLARKLGQQGAEAVLSEVWQNVAEELQIPFVEIMEDAWVGAVPAGVAAAHGRMERFKALCERGEMKAEDVMQPDSQGLTALHRAAGSGSAKSVEMVAELIPHEVLKSAVNAVDLHGLTVAHHSVLAGDDPSCMRAVVRMVRRAFNRNEEVMRFFSLQDGMHRQLTHIAASRNYTEILSRLHEEGLLFSRPMGPTELCEGAAVLCPCDPVYRLAHVKSFVGMAPSRITIEFEDDHFEAEVFLEGCVFGPTPLQIAVKLGLREVFSVLNTHAPSPPAPDADAAPAPGTPSAPDPRRTLA